MNPLLGCVGYSALVFGVGVGVGIGWVFTRMRWVVDDKRGGGLLLSRLDGASG